MGSERVAGRTAAITGGAFAVLGVAGLIPRATRTTPAGLRLFGLWTVNPLYTVVRLVLGLTGLALSRKPHAAAPYLVGTGSAYAAIALTDAARPNAPNTDSALHAVLATLMLLGWAASRRASSNPA